jgi:hypothetical protein
MHRLAVLVAAVLFALPAEAQSNIVIEGKRPPLEPGKVFAGNDQGVLQQLRALMARSEAETDAVIAELEGYGLDKLSPIILMEYSRRLKIKAHADWRYWYELASLRAKFDQRACKDSSAPQFVTVAAMEFHGGLEQLDRNGFKDAVLPNDDERWRILRRIMDSGAAFKSKASAWYVCSHGMANMTAAMSGRTLSLNDWWTGKSALETARKQAEKAIGDMLKQQGF